MKHRNHLSMDKLEQSSKVLLDLTNQNLEKVIKLAFIYCGVHYCSVLRKTLSPRSKGLYLTFYIWGKISYFAGSIGGA